MAGESGMDVKTHYELAASSALWQRAIKVIPGGTSTNSKRVDVFADAASFPAHIVEARGCRVTDADGNVYIDFVAGLAPIVLGYAEPRVQRRIAAQLDRNILASLPPPEEVELAELLVEIIPCAEMVRFMKTGAEAASAAVRAARTITRRDMVLCCGYHGWHDWFAAVQWPDGIPDAVGDLTRAFDFNDIDAAEALVANYGKRVACIVVTPALYGTHPASGFLEGLRRLADAAGALLIFDEIITGFRWSIGGAQAYYHVIPDLAVFGKAMANGMPIAALVGRREFMAPLDRAWITSTYASEALSIVAALETIAILREGDALERLRGLAIEMCDGLSALADRAGIGFMISEPLPALRFQPLVGDDRQAAFNDAFIRACARKGVLIRRDGPAFSLCLMAAMTSGDIAESLGVFDEALAHSLEQISAR